MVYLIINWVLSTMSLLGVAALVPGFRVTEFESELLAAGVVGLLSASLGLILKHVNRIVTAAMSGAFLFLMDALLFRMSALMVPGFAMSGFFPALAGAAVLLALNVVLLRILPAKAEGFDSGSLLSS